MTINQNAAYENSEPEPTSHEITVTGSFSASEFADGSALLLVHSDFKFNLIKFSALAPGIIINTETIQGLTTPTGEYAQTIGTVVVHTHPSSLVFHVIDDFPIDQDGIIGLSW